MQYPLLMRRVNRFGNGFHVSRGFLGRERFVPDQLRQVLPFDILHREIMLSRLLPDLIDRNDVRMLEAGGGLRFNTKALDERFAGQFSKEQQLHRDNPVQTFLSRLIDNPHPASGDLFQ